MTSPSIEAIEQSIQRAKTTVEFGQALERLRSNKDFKKVVLEGYFEREAVRLVHLKAAPAMQTVELQASIVKEIDAIGAFASYLDNAMRFAGLAAKSIEDDEQTRDEILKEELNNV